MFANLILAEISTLTTILAITFSLICLFLILVILIQKPKGGGLSGAFGGGGGGGSAVFGAKTGDVLTWFTVICFVVFLIFGMGMVWSTQADQKVKPSVLDSSAEGGSGEEGSDSDDDKE